MTPLKKISSLRSFVFFFITCGSLAFADWPQFRGPDRSGRSSETNVLQSWDREGPPQRWLSEDIGLGYSGPAISDGKVFILGTKKRDEYLYSLDEQSGKILWSAKIGNVLKNNWGDGPRGTPAVDGNRVYAMGGQGTLICAAVVDGKVLWKKTMKSLGGKIQKWGYTESVLVDGDRVLCTPGGNKGTMAALNKHSGKLVWQSKEWKDNAQYASIVPAEIHGVKQFVQLTQKQFAGISVEDGKVLWKADFRGGRTAVVPTPVVYDNRVYITAGYGAGSMQIEVSADQSISTVYSNKVMKNHHGGVIRVGDYLYGYSDAVGWVCQDWKTGDKVWAEKKKLGKGSIGYADGKLYCLEERSGTVVLIDASPHGWKESGRFTLALQSDRRSSSGRIWTHPVIANKKLYLRDQELLYCFDVGG